MRSIILLSVFLVLAGLSFSIDVSSCQLISSPGSYVLTADLFGAPVPAFSSGPASACIKIVSSDVDLNCDGFSIDFNGTATSSPNTKYGILINNDTSVSLTNVSVGNCPNITRYTSHIEIQNVSNGRFSNITVYGLYPNFGMMFRGSSNNVITNIVSRNGYNGVALLDGSNNNLLNNSTFINHTFSVDVEGNFNNVTNVLSDGQTGPVVLWGFNIGGNNNRITNSRSLGNDIGFIVFGDNNVLSNNIANDNSVPFGGVGFSVSGSDNVLTANLADNNNESGFEVNGDGNNLTGNNATDNLGDGYSINGDGNTVNCISSGNGGNGVYISGDDNTLTSCDVFNNGGHGVFMEGASDNSLLGNEVNDNALSGVAVTDFSFCSEGCTFRSSTGNTFTNNFVHDNGENGFMLMETVGVGVSDNTFVSDNATNNGLHGLYIQTSDSNDVDPSFFCNNGQHGIFINDSDFTTVEDSVACNNPLSGIKLLNASGTDLINNEVYGNNDSGIDLEFSDSNFLSGNLAHDNADQGFHFDESDFNDIDGNQGYDNPRGFELREAALNSFTGNEAYNNTGEGFQLLFLATNNNIFTGNSAHDNGDAGFAAGEGPHDNSFFDNAAFSNLYGFYLTNFANNNYLANNTAENNTFDGFRIENSETNLLEDNEASGNGDDGFILVAFTVGTDNTLMNNVAHDNSNDGFEINNDVNNTITNNIAYNNFRGFHLFVTSGNLLQDNLAYDNTDGFSLEGSDDNLLDSNIAENNSGDGISIVGSFDATDNTLTDNTVCGNDRGIFILFDYDNTLSGNTVCNNANAGVWIELSTGNSMNADHLFGNSPDFRISTDSSTPTNITMSGVSFDRDAGDFTNYTNLSLSDNLEFGETTAYSIDHSAQPAPLPTSEHRSFAGKFVELTDLSLADHAIDSITWHWSDNELTNYTESEFRLLKYNGTWFPRNNTPDTAGNTLSLSNVSSFSVFGILQLTFQEGGNDGGGPGPEPECTTDAQCPATEQCVSEECVPVPCECGAVENHQCVAYQCCSNADCPVGFGCVDHVCTPQEQPPEEEPEQCNPPGCCTSDSQCGGSQTCSIPAGSQKGSCQDITSCGLVQNHSVVEQWECGGPNCPSCPAGESCVNHLCLGVNDVSCPPSGIVGDEKTCAATEDGGVCVNCDYVITAPDGKQYTGKTDDRGTFVLPLDLKGTYKVTLFKDGSPVKTVEVRALPQSPPGEEEKPTTAGFDPLSILWLLILIAIIALAVFLWRSRQGKKGKA